MYGSFDECPFCGHPFLKVKYLSKAFADSELQDLNPVSRKLVCFKCNKFFITISFYNLFYNPVDFYKRTFMNQWIFK